MARARAFARDRLAAWHLAAETAEAASLVVSELVTNTVRHSGAQDVTLQLARCVSHLWIEVVDTGVWRHPKGSEQDGLAEGGRGFRLIEALSQFSGVHPTPHGTHAWALLDASATGTPRPAVTRAPRYGESPGGASRRAAEPRA